VISVVLHIEVQACQQHHILVTVWIADVPVPINDLRENALLFCWLDSMLGEHVLSPGA
jgi:hypothetical protein